jgi:cytoskeletal protein RodZ
LAVEAANFRDRKQGIVVNFIILIVVIIWIVAGLINLSKKAAESQRQARERELMERELKNAKPAPLPERPQPVQRQPERTSRPRPTRPLPGRPRPEPTPTAEIPPALQELMDILMPKQPQVETAPFEQSLEGESLEKVEPLEPKPEPAPKPVSKSAPVRKIRTARRELRFSRDPLVNGLIFGEIFGKPLCKRPRHQKRIV